MRQAVKERFWAKVDKNGPIPAHRPDLGACWIWLGAINKAGYGHAWNGQKVCRAHRLSYELLVGKFPPKKMSDHLCRVRRCVNPEHIEPVTNRQNVLRGNSPIAGYAKQTQCKRGHPYTARNTYFYKSKVGRDCRICRRLLKPAYLKRRGLTPGGRIPKQCVR